MPARPPLLLPLLALTALFVLAVPVLADWAPLDRADHALSETFRNHGEIRPGLVDTLRVATDVAATVPFVVAGVLVAFALFVRGRRAAALFCAIVTGTVPALWSLAHLLLHRPRPTAGFVTVSSNGFPSGHTSNAAAAALVVVLLAWPRLARGGRFAVVAAATAFAVFIGLTRVALLAHWPTDVLGGWLLALGVVPLAAYAVRERPPAPAD